MMHELYINDVAAGTKGIYLEKAPAIPIATDRGTWQQMPGLDGGYWVSEDARNFVELTLNIYVDAGSDINAAIEYLMTAERVRVTPWAWEWNVNTHECAPSFSEWLEIPGEGYECEVTFAAKPYRTVWPHVGYDATISSTVTINNPYSVSAMPVITASNPYVMKIGDVTITSTGSGTTVDCENKTITGGASYVKIESTSGSVRPVWPELKPGNNTVKVTSGMPRLTVQWRLR